MKTTVWVLCTTIPGDVDPCLPQVFGDSDSATKALDEAMRSEWEHNGPDDDEGRRLPYPGPDEALAPLRQRSP